MRIDSTIQRRAAAVSVAVALAALLLAALFLALTARVARAGGVVSPCNQANLAAAMAGGGSVTFNCGGPATITLTSQIVITQDTTIDGGALGLVTISGGSSTRIFSTAVGVNLSLFNLKLAQGDAAPGFGGAVYALGPTVISNSTFYNNAAVEGGAVYAGSQASVTVTTSLFLQNSADDGGGALSVLGGAQIAASEFFTNTSARGGGILALTGAVAITNSRFAYNLGGSEGGGLTAIGGPTSIAGSEFYSNSAEYGGAISAYHWFTLSHSSLHHNVANLGGGALGLYNASTAAGARLAATLAPLAAPVGHALLSDVQIYNNVAEGLGGYGGGVDAEMNWVGFERTRVYDNRIDNGNALYAGGGLAIFAGTAVFTDSAVFGNLAGTGPGGGIHASYHATVTLQTTAVYSNVALAGAGGGIDVNSNGGQTQLRIYNSTLSGNAAATMGGGVNMNAASTHAIISFTTLYGNLAAAGHNFTGTTELYSSILAGSGGLNCGGGVKTYGFNLEDGDTCTLGATGDITGTNPLLGPLGPNGGPTWSHGPLAGSPAIDAGDPADCPPTDQRGAARPVDGDNVGWARCDMGAVEFAALIAKILIPLVTR